MKLSQILRFAVLAFSCAMFLESAASAQNATTGFFDYADETRIIGWAYDADQGFNPVRVRVFDGATQILEVKADRLRPDLPSSFRGRTHGFDAALPPLTIGAHTLKAFGVDDNGALVLLGQRSVSVTYQSPAGCIQSVSHDSALLRVGGWAFDANAGSAPIYVHLYVDGAFAGYVLANVDDASLSPVLGSSRHRFVVTAPRPSPGIHVLQVYAINAGAGQNRLLAATVPLTIDLRETLAPLGARLTGATSARWVAADGTFRWSFSDGQDPREYVVNPADPAIMRGGITVREQQSGILPIDRGGTFRRSQNGTLQVPENLFTDPSWQVVMGPIEFDGAKLTLRYAEAAEGIARSKTITYSIRGKTLVIDVVADGGSDTAGGNYAGLYQGRATLANPRSIFIPYLADPVIIGSGVFVTQLIDSALSHANGFQMEGPLAIPSPAGLRHSRSSRYHPDSAGKVEPLCERMYLTVSSTADAVFSSSDNPVSPYRAQAAENVIYDTWGVDRTALARSPWSIPFQEQSSHFTNLKQAYGLDKVMVLRHNWGSDKDFSMPKLFPANPTAGGDDGLVALSHLCRQQGWLFGVHENISCMFGPSPVVASPPWYDPAKIARNADLSFKTLGSLITGGQEIKAYAIAADREPALAQQHSNYVAGRYFNNTTFWDVRLYLPPSLDLDVANPGSRTFEQGVRSVKSAAGVFRDAYRGPLNGECCVTWNYVDHWTLVYAGYVDGVEREIIGGEDGWILPDFELKVVQPLQVNQGMGYLGRYFKDATRNESDFPAERHHDLIRSRSIAYGHTGFISDSLVAQPWQLLPPYVNQPKTMKTDQIVKEYYLFQALQKRMFASRVASITYDDGSAKDLSTKLLELAFGSKSQAAFTASADTFFKSPRLHILYENGLEVHVNTSRTQSWTLAVQGESFVLPPAGFVARRRTGGDEFLAFTGRRNGALTTTSAVVSPEYGFTDDRAQRRVTITRPAQPTILLPY